jgi:hypothetical protein
MACGKRDSRSDFHLVDEGLVVLEHVLDGVFDGDDVVASRGVDLIENGCQSGGLPGTGDPGHQCDAAGLLDEVVDRLGQVEFLEGGDLVVDATDDDAHVVALVERRETETSDIGQPQRVVRRAFFLEPALQMLGHGFVDDLLDVFCGHGWVVNRPQDGVDTHVGGVLTLK